MAGILVERQNLRSRGFRRETQTVCPRHVSLSSEQLMWDIPRATLQPISSAATRNGLGSTCRIRWLGRLTPAEQYAIKTGTHPAITTKENVDNFRRQIQALTKKDWIGKSTRRTRTIIAGPSGSLRCIRRDSLRREVPSIGARLGTVLANEEVIDGKSERGGHPVVATADAPGCCVSSPTRPPSRRSETLDWPESIKSSAKALDRPFDRGRSGGSRKRRAEGNEPHNPS